MAALLACGPGSVLTHHTAAALWGFAAARPPGTPVDVGLPRNARGRPGIRVHRIRTLHSSETTTLHGLRLTTPERTLLDLAAACSERA